jgi:uncharacterized protein YqfB (UPF0267 family)
MTRLYPISLLLSAVILLGCSKDFLKKYDKRIIGSWRVDDVKDFGLGGNTDNLSFTEGVFSFQDDGTVTYRDASSQVFQGRWDIIKKYEDDETVHGLELTVTNYLTMQTLSEYYDDIAFTGTDKFNARIYSGLHTYVTKFRR